LSHSWPSGTTVISDRFAPSTLAYQGYGRGLDLELLRAATSLAIGTCQPDLIVLFDCPVDVAHERRPRRDDDRFEASGRDFLERVRRGYLDMAAEAPQTWLIVDATPSFGAVYRNPRVGHPRPPRLAVTDVFSSLLGQEALAERLRLHARQSVHAYLFVSSRPAPA
jgi:hypothetical protein